MRWMAEVYWVGTQRRYFCRMDTALQAGWKARRQSRQRQRRHHRFGRLSDPLLAPYIFFTLKGINRQTDTSRGPRLISAWLFRGCNPEPCRRRRSSIVCVWVYAWWTFSIVYHTGSQQPDNSEKVRMFPEVVGFRLDACRRRFACVGQIMVPEGDKYVNNGRYALTPPSWKGSGSHQQSIRPTRSPDDAITSCRKMDFIEYSFGR